MLQEDRGYCYLEREMDVYDTELHAIEEALLNSLTTLTDTKYIYICINNSAAIQALQDNRDNGEASCKTIHYSRIL
jgi:hypothetical protein